MSHPFNQDGDVWTWVLFVILATTIAILWTRVLKSITE